MQAHERMDGQGPETAALDRLPGVQRMLRELEREMPGLQVRHPDLFALANAWTERHDAILEACPPVLRPEVTRRLQRIGIRWGLVPGARITREFRAVGAAAGADRIAGDQGAESGPVTGAGGTPTVKREA